MAAQLLGWAMMCLNSRRNTIRFRDGLPNSNASARSIAAAPPIQCACGIARRPGRPDARVSCRSNRSANAASLRRTRITRRLTKAIAGCSFMERSSRAAGPATIGSRPASTAGSAIRSATARPAPGTRRGEGGGKSLQRWGSGPRGAGKFYRREFQGGGQTGCGGISGATS